MKTLLTILAGHLAVDRMQRVADGLRSGAIEKSFKSLASQFIWTLASPVVIPLNWLYLAALGYLVRQDSHPKADLAILMLNTKLMLLGRRLDWLSNRLLSSAVTFAEANVNKRQGVDGPEDRPVNAVEDFISRYGSKGAEAANPDDETLFQPLDGMLTEVRDHLLELYQELGFVKKSAIEEDPDFALTLAVLAAHGNILSYGGPRLDTFKVEKLAVEGASESQVNEWIFYQQAAARLQTVLGSILSIGFNIPLSDIFDDAMTADERSVRIDALTVDPDFTRDEALSILADVQTLMTPKSTEDGEIVTHEDAIANFLEGLEELEEGQRTEDNETYVNALRSLAILDIWGFTEIMRSRTPSYLGCVGEYE